MQVFGSSGVRGVAGTELTPPFVGHIAAGRYAYALPALIGRAHV